MFVFNWLNLNLNLFFFTDTKLLQLLNVGVTKYRILVTQLKSGHYNFDLKKNDSLEKSKKPSTKNNLKQTLNILQRLSALNYSQYYCDNSNYK